jgi:hypothetical protein
METAALAITASAVAKVSTQLKKRFRLLPRKQERGANACNKKVWTEGWGDNV